MCCITLLLVDARGNLCSLERIHRITLWVSVFVIIRQRLQMAIGHTVLFQNFAAGVHSHGW
jgi:hypothetical protein